MARGYVVSGGSLELEYLLRRLMQVPELFLRYLKMLVLPYPLKAVHTVIPPRGFDGRVLVSMVGALVLLGSIYLFRRKRIYLFAAAWVVLFFLPVSNILPMGYIFIAERNAYLPGVGLSIAVAALVAGAGRSRRVMIGLCCAFYAAGLFLSALRCGVWRDDLSLYSAMAAESPESSIGHYNLGKYHAGRGDSRVALSHFQRAAEGFPKSRELYSDLGTSYWENGNNEMALRYLERSFDPESRDVGAYLLAARIAESEGDREKGRRYLAAASGFLQSQQGPATFVDVAAVLTREAERLQGQGNRAQARSVYRRALLFDPGSFLALVGLGSLEAEAGDLERAVELMQRAASIDPKNPLPHYNLSLAFRLLGRPSEAEASQREYDRLRTATLMH
jgi:tetratricopeptide (TPR) repeat protein